MKVADLKYFIRELLTLKKRYEILKSGKWKEAKEQFKIIQSMHSIEKGLSLKEPRVGFGADKVLSLLGRIESYKNCGYDCSHASVQMALKALEEYIEWNRTKGVENDRIIEKFTALRNDVPTSGIEGGTNFFTRDEILDFDAKELTKVIKTRHSMRNFSDEAVDIEKVKQAIEEANLCPSACNRQPTHVHIITGEKELEYMRKNLQGTGGFSEKCSTFLLLTGNVSAFDFNANNHWLVSGGIFAGYLSLTLHARGIAACVIQRTLIRASKTNEMRKALSIPDNEEFICAFGLGMYPEEFRTPKSTRLPIEELITVH